MTESDREIFEKTLVGMKALEVEMSAFRDEMREFKADIAERMRTLESDTRLCQSHPETCATARRLDDHIRHDTGRATRITAILGCVGGLGGFALTLLKSIFGG